MVRMDGVYRKAETVARYKPPTDFEAVRNPLRVLFESCQDPTPEIFCK